MDPTWKLIAAQLNQFRDVNEYATILMADRIATVFEDLRGMMQEGEFNRKEFYRLAGVMDYREDPAINPITRHTIN